MKRTAIFVLALAVLLSVTACAVSEQKAAANTRLKTAKAMFAERCKTAGEFIHRTAENVEGIYLMKLRPRDMNRGNQYLMDDPYGRDTGGDGYIIDFLLGRDAKGSLVSEQWATNGYRYIEALDPKYGKRYRYTASMKVVGRKKEDAPNIQIELARNPNFDLNNYGFLLDRVPASGPRPRYGVTYDDISTLEDRDYWIAGGSLKVIDLETNEVMAERIGYMMDTGQGDDSGGRAPWILAARYACPKFPVTPGGWPFKGYQTRNFVERVLSIKQIKEEK